MHLITKVEDTFLVTGRGLVVVPGPLRSEVAGGADIPVELRLPDGKVFKAYASLQNIFQSPPPPPHIAKQWVCILSGTTKEQVPMGTEVWGPDAAFDPISSNVSHFMSPSAQFEFVRDYNWDDGFVPVKSILLSECCSLETALLAFWRREGPWSFVEGTENEDQKEFVYWLADRITRGHYQSKLSGFDPKVSEGISASQIFKLKKAGLPAIFFGDTAND